MAAVPAAQATDYTVTNLADSGPGSLRDAIDATNVDPVGDRILFQSGLTGTITLENDLTPLDGPVEIVGPGKDQMKIDGGAENYNSLLETQSDLKVSGITLANGWTDGKGGAISATLSDVVVENSRLEGNRAGSAGGGISVAAGSLTLRDSEVTGNFSAGDGAGVYVYYQSAADISDSTLSGNKSVTGAGGASLGPSSYGKSKINDSVFEGNTGALGGGLYAKGGIDVDSTLFSGNTAERAGGAVTGSLVNSIFAPSDSSVTNSTFTGNKAEVGGALLAVRGTKIQSSTIVGNTSTNSSGPAFAEGAGILAMNGEVKLDNTIVSANTPTDIRATPAATDPFPASAGSIAGSFNLIGTAPGVSVTDTVPGSNISSTNPVLGALADNGGPTETMLPTESSPVVNKGSSPLKVDQRGLTRPVDFNSIPFSTADGANGADIGAVELQGGPLPPVPPSNAFTFGKVKLNKKKGVATLQVKVPGKGKLLLLGSKDVKSQNKSAKKKSTVTLTVKAKGKAAKTLKKKGKVKVKASVKFTPTGGRAKNKSKTVKLIKAKKKK